MLRSTLVRVAAVVGVTAVTTLVWTAPASAHVTVKPGSATQGGYTTVAFRVPNERDNANTTTVEINLPAEAPIASVSLKPLAGWTATAEKTKLPTPIKREGGDVTEAITKIIWTADANNQIKAGQFQEFEVSLGPLPAVNQIVFKALQTYSNGEIVRWIEEPAAGQDEPEHPAPVLKLAASTGDPHGTAASTAPVAAADNATQDENGGTNWLGIVGVLLGLAGLVAGLLAYQRAARTTT